MFFQYLNLLFIGGSLVYAAGESKKVSDGWHTPEQSFFNGFGYKYTMLSLTIFAVVLMVITLTCIISQTPNRGKSHPVNTKEKEQGTSEPDSIPDRREKPSKIVTIDKEKKDNKIAKEVPKQFSHQSVQEQPQDSPNVYYEISEKAAKKKKVKTSKKGNKESAKKSIKIHCESSISTLSTEDEYVSIKRKKSTTNLKGPEAYTNLRKESVGPGIYEEISIGETNGEQANFIV